MFLELAHKRLEVYAYAKRLVVLCSDHLREFPSDERYALVSQIRRCALSVLLNVAEGSSRSSPLERKRFFEISRSSLVELDAAFDVANDLCYLRHDFSELKSVSVSLYRLLSALIKAQQKN